MPAITSVKNSMSQSHRLQDKDLKPDKDVLQVSGDTVKDHAEGERNQPDDQVTLQYTEDAHNHELTPDEDICVEYTFELDDFTMDVPVDGRSKTASFTSVASGDIASVAAQVASHAATQVFNQIADQVTAKLQNSIALKQKTANPTTIRQEAPPVCKTKPTSKAGSSAPSRGELLMISLGTQNTSQAELRRSLAALDYCLARKVTKDLVELSICGKSALILKGYSHDDTPDIDVIDDIPANILEYAEAFSVSNQARYVVPIDAHVFARRSVYPLDFDVLRVYLLSDADLLLNHISRGLRKDITNLMATHLLERVSVESVKEAVMGYKNPEILWKQYMHLRALGEF